MFGKEDTIEIKSNVTPKETFDFFINSISEFDGRNIKLGDLRKKIITNRGLVNNLIEVRRLNIEKAKKENEMIKLIYIYGIFGICPGDKICINFLDKNEDAIVNSIRGRKDIADKFIYNLSPIDDDIELIIKRTSTIFISMCSDGSKVILNGVEFCNKLIKNYTLNEI